MESVGRRRFKRRRQPGNQGAIPASKRQRFVTMDGTGYQVCVVGTSREGIAVDFSNGQGAGEAPSSSFTPMISSSPQIQRWKGKRRKGSGLKNKKRGKIELEGQYVDFSKPEQLKGVFNNPVGHQVSLLVNNPSLTKYMNSSSSDFTSVSMMMKLFDNTLFCKHEALCKRSQSEVIPKLFENRGFLEAVRYHLCCLPGRASNQERVSSVFFIEQLCKLFKLLLSSCYVDLATDILPVDTLLGTTGQLSSQELRFKVLHDKATEIIQMRDKVRQIKYNVSETKEVATDVVVLPTKAELQTNTLPANLQRNVINGPYTSELQYLNIQYCLLREDFIHPLRCAIHQIESGEEDSHKVKFYDATIRSKGYSSYESSTCEVAFTAPGHHLIQWDRSKRLQFGDLVCLMNDTSGIMIFATVAERKVDHLKKGLVTLDIRTNIDVMGLPPVGYRMFESPSFYAAYAPVLRHLYALQKSPRSLPFSKYIVKLKTDVKLPEYVCGEAYTLNLHNIVCDEEHNAGEQSLCASVNILSEEAWEDLPTPNFDDSQKRALRSALTQELSIIQGPPGTGKTYIGLKLVETLLLNRASWDTESSSAVVVVCYTNHALDQFLEGIIRKVGVTIEKDIKVRRVGGRSKSQLLKEYNINQFVLRRLRAKKIFGFWKKENSKVVEKLDTLNDLKKRMFDPDRVRVYASFLGAEYRSLLFSFSHFIADASTSTVTSWLGFPPPHHTPDYPNTAQRIAEDDRRIAGEDIEGEIIEAYGSEQIQKCFNHLAKAEPLTDTRANEQAKLDPEQIEPYVRLQLFKYCLLSTRGKLEDKLKHGKKGEERYEEKRRFAMIHCLKEADLIGLTTTIAAKYNWLLSEMNAKIIIVEEAAECLEGHIISSLNQKTQHLILIGDHKQLRPKTNDHILAREYHLDVSLFERLIRNGFPHTTLKLQHRMRPEISALVSSHIYNGALMDAPVTSSYADVSGMKYNVFFVDHTEPESTYLELNSKDNVFEARFLAQVCKYLLFQKVYTEEQITVITPYTGQMFTLRDNFSDMPNVKITPIDSYQGEENDIILVSLVRSEALGFVADPSRVCVAMSRAKHGLYVIGNLSKLFITRSNLWRSLVDTMKKAGKFGTSLPLVCKGHGTTTEVCTLDDFKLVADGGCFLPCVSRLPCRHMCPLLCHPDPDNGVHGRIQCKEICRRLCNKKAHRCKKVCCECSSNRCGPCKETITTEIPQCGHLQHVPCHCDPMSFVCQEACGFVLPCGHRCWKMCGESHALECIELITRKCPKQHEGKADCYLTDELYSRRCKAACEEPLMCGHPCQGTCGECRQGRLHKPCKEKCDRTLTCGHTCSSPCAHNCPPCEKQCPVLCPHGPCGHKCFQPCLPCPHGCQRQCEHQQCSQICGEKCDCEPCSKPCSMKLQCGHQCMGLCGEKCPDVCRICDKHNFNEKVPLIFGTEELEEGPNEIRIIMLDCGHMFEVRSLDKYMKMSMENKIQWKRCIICNKPVFITNRYRDLVVGITEDLNQIKDKEKSFSSYERRKYMNQVGKLVERTTMLKHPRHFLRHMESLSDKRLQCEYHIFYAEQSVVRATEDIEGEKASITSVISGHVAKEYLKYLLSATTSLQSQAKDFLSKLQTYRTFVLTDQVIHDIKAEQHRIQLLSAALKMLLQLKLSCKAIKSTDQVKLDGFLKDLEINDGKSCTMKMRPVEFDSSMHYIEQLRKEHPEIFSSEITREEKQMIVRALQAKPGSWYKCPKGHVYNIGECGGAMEEALCPECRSAIGGGSHRLRDDNTHAGDFDGSYHAAWSIGANLGNFDLRDLR